MRLFGTREDAEVEAERVSARIGRSIALREVNGRWAFEVVRDPDRLSGLSPVRRQAKARVRLHRRRMR